jgi:hypothetical protein
VALANSSSQHLQPQSQNLVLPRLRWGPCGYKPPAAVAGGWAEGRPLTSAFWGGLWAAELGQGPGTPLRGPAREPRGRGMQRLSAGDG